MSITAPSGHPRRYDLDWLRVIALACLIVYHVLCAFNSGGWEIKSDYAGVWADGVVELITPWRMVLVFVVGGAATRFLFDKFDVEAFVANRTMRLLVPLVVGTIFLAPPQIYVHLRAAGLEHGSFLDFWAFRFWTSRELHGVHFPDPAHLWFLPYLFMYAVGTALLWSWAPRRFEAIANWVDRAPLILLFVLAAAWMVLMQAVVEPWKHRTLVFYWDWNGHLRFAPAFLFGLFIAQADQFWRKLVAARWLEWGASMALGVAAYVTWTVTLDPTRFPVLSALFGATVLFAMLALGARFLNRPSRALSYWNDAVLPIYVLHQTILVVLAAGAGLIHWPVAIALPFLLIATFGLSTALYHFAIRHNRWLRLAFGQRAQPAAPPPLTRHRAAF